MVEEETVEAELLVDQLEVGIPSPKIQMIKKIKTMTRKTRRVKRKIRTIKTITSSTFLNSLQEL